MFKREASCRTIVCIWKLWGEGLKGRKGGKGGKGGPRVGNLTMVLEGWDTCGVGMEMFEYVECMLPHFFVCWSACLALVWLQVQDVVPSIWGSGDGAWSAIGVRMDVDDTFVGYECWPLMPSVFRLLFLTEILVKILTKSLTESLNMILNENP